MSLAAIPSFATRLDDQGALGLRSGLRAYGEGEGCGNQGTAGTLVTALVLCFFCFMLLLFVSSSIRPLVRGWGVGR